MILLTNTTETLELSTSAAVSTDFYVSYADHTTSSFTPGQQNGNISTATTTTILEAPGSSTQRQVKLIAVRNRSTTTAQTVSVRHDTSGTERFITADIALQPGDVLEYTDGAGFVVKDSGGRVKVYSPEDRGFSGFTYEYYKNGLTTSEGAGVRYLFARDNGMPGGWVPGTPGLNGWWVDASQTSNAANPAGATQVGSPRLQNPSSGAWYLAQGCFASSTAGLVQLVDIIWYNTGLVVTTTTAQSITMPASSKPSRDLSGTTNGEGWMAGIYVTTATTNAGAVTNTTMSYTNSAGTGSRTATIPSFPATANAGSFIPFALQDGDRGIQSIASVTLGTSYGGGAISLILYRVVASFPTPLTNTGSVAPSSIYQAPGIRIYSGSALVPMLLPGAASTFTLSGSIHIVER